MGSLSSNSNIANSTVITFNPQTGAAYTLQPGDSNKVVTLSNAGGCTVKGDPLILGPGFHCWIEARNNAANLITQFLAEKFFINGATTAGVNSFNLSPQNLQTGIGWDDVVHIVCDGVNWHVIQGGPILTSSLTLTTPNIGNATAISINFGQSSINAYANGSWTPRAQGSTIAGTGTYTTQNGYYTRIGQIVRASAEIVWTAHTGTGQLQIANYPYTAGDNAAMSVYFFNYGVVGPFVMAQMNSGTTTSGNAQTTVGGVLAAVTIQGAGNYFSNAIYSV